MQQIAIAILVVVMMIAIGLRTETRDFGEVWKRPGTLAVGVLVNVVVAPLVVILGTGALGLPAEVTVGFIICASSPGGPTGPLFAAQAGGHLAMAIVAMISLSLLSVLTAPPTITQALGLTAEIDASHLLLPMMGTLIAFQLVPLMIGMVIRRVRLDLANRLSNPANVAANVLLLLVIAGLLATKGRLLAEVGLVAVAASIGFVLVNLALGFVVARPGPVRRSWSMVTGVRNISLALLISATYFPEPLTDAAILTFGLFTMVIPFAVARLVARRDASRSPSQA